MRDADETLPVPSLLLLPVLAAAQTFPSRSIQMLVPYPAGGTTDVMARAMQEPMQKALGQNIIIENKSGASGVLAAREVARGKPDGHIRCCSSTAASCRSRRMCRRTRASTA
jgi:tripartite-type tricarboxylate transporter receptor subunit TctC